MRAHALVVHRVKLLDLRVHELLLLSHLEQRSKDDPTDAYECKRQVEILSKSGGHALSDAA